MKRLESTLSPIVIVIFIGLCAVQAQTAPPLSGDVGYLNVHLDHVHWESPESLVAALHSADDETRLKAMQLLGLTAKQAQRAVSPQTSSKTAGERVLTPDQIELRYAAFADDATRQAVIAVEDAEGQMTYAAVAVPGENGWERIAAFDCWCKYEMYVGQDTLTTFVQLRPASGNPTTPQRYELVLRASGGGTGTYTQNEAHYRILHGEIRRVLSFVSSHRSCPAEKCTVEKRWFYPTAVKGSAGGVLVSSRGQFMPPDIAVDIQFFVRALQNRYFHPPTCRMYKWNESTFEYAPTGTSQPCNNAR